MAIPPPVPPGGSCKDPVIVLTYAHSGHELLRTMLEGHPHLMCVPDAGIVPLCRHAMETWRQVERCPGGRPSALALAAVRSMVGALITPLLARDGKPRWCDISPGSALAAPAFLALFPGTQFICLHRNCLDVVSAVLKSSPWGVMEGGLRRFTVAHPGNHAAAIANYWVIHTKAMTDFQEEYAGRCITVRYEDLCADPEQVRKEVFAFLGEDICPCRDGGPGSGDVPHRAGGSAPRAGDSGMPGGMVPAALIPPHVLAEVNDSLARLGYPVIPYGKQ